MKNHQILAQHGFHFAPRSLAALFGFQKLAIQLYERIPAQQILGCHFSSSCKLTGINQITIYHHQFRSFDEIKNNARIYLLVEAGMEVIFPVNDVFPHGLRINKP